MNAEQTRAVLPVSSSAVNGRILTYNALGFTFGFSIRTALVYLQRISKRGKLPPPDQPHEFFQSLSAWLSC